MSPTRATLTGGLPIILAARGTLAAVGADRPQEEAAGPRQDRLPLSEPAGLHSDGELFLVDLARAVGRRRGAIGSVNGLGCDRLDLLGVLLLAAAGKHLEAVGHDLGLPVTNPRVVVPLAGLDPALDVDELPLRQELARSEERRVGKEGR